MSIHSQPVILFPHIPSLCGTVRLQHARLVLTRTYLFTLLCPCDGAAARRRRCTCFMCLNTLVDSERPAGLRAGWKHSR